MEYRINNRDSYISKVVKLVPGEIIALYLMAINFTDDYIIEPIAFFGCLILTPFFMIVTLKIKWKNNKVGKTHIIVSMLAFVIWIAISGTLFTIFTWWKGWIGSIIALFFTFIAGAILQLKFFKPTPPSIRIGQNLTASIPANTNKIIDCSIFFPNVSPIEVEWSGIYYKNVTQRQAWTKNKYVEIINQQGIIPESVYNQADNLTFYFVAKDTLGNFFYWGSEQNNPQYYEKEIDARTNAYLFVAN